MIEKSSRGAAFGDYDNDGNVDVVVISMNDRPTLLHNETVSGHHWATIRLVGTVSNADRIDRLEIRWPSGLVETVNGLPSDRFYVAQEGQGVKPPAGPR
jgi:hypothetical protein